MARNALSPPAFGKEQAEYALDETSASPIGNEPSLSRTHHTMNMAVLSKRNLLWHARRLLRLVGKSSGSSHAVALGMAIGFFVGWMPFFGLQTVLALLLCHLFRANKIVPLLLVWLSNPVTFVPIFTINYWVGWKLVGGPPMSEIVAVLEKLAVPPGSDGGSWLAAWWTEITDGTQELLGMGWGMLQPFCLGSALIGMALAVLSYFITRRFVDAFRNALHEKKLRNQNRRLQSRKAVRVRALVEAPSVPPPAAAGRRDATGEMPESETSLR